MGQTTIGFLQLRLGITRWLLFEMGHAAKSAGKESGRSLPPCIKQSGWVRWRRLLDRGISGRGAMGNICRTNLRALNHRYCTLAATAQTEEGEDRQTDQCKAEQKSANRPAALRTINHLPWL
ncbi:hypothetical protein GCM10009127_23860 [Alteraurantiacibacter aestuarii]